MIVIFFGAWLLRMAEEQELAADNVEGRDFFDAVLSEMEELYASGLHFKEKEFFDKVKTALVAKTKFKAEHISKMKKKGLPVQKIQGDLCVHQSIWLGWQGVDAR